MTTPLGSEVPGSQPPAAWLGQIFPKGLEERIGKASGKDVAKELILQKKGDELSFVEKGKQWAWSEVGHKETWVGVWKRITRMWNQAIHGVSYDFKANLRELDKRIEIAYKSIGTMNKELSEKLFYLSRVHDGLVVQKNAPLDIPPITPERVKKICSPIAGAWGLFVLSSSLESTEEDSLSHLIKCLSGTERRKELERTYNDVKDRLTKLSEKPDSSGSVRMIQEVLNGASKELPETRLELAQKMLTEAELAPYKQKLISLWNEPNAPSFRNALDTITRLQGQVSVDKDSISFIERAIREQEDFVEQKKCLYAAEVLKMAAEKLKGSSAPLDNQIGRLLNVVEGIDPQAGGSLERLTGLQNMLETVIRPFYELNSQINTRIEELKQVFSRGSLSKEVAGAMISKLEEVRASFRYEEANEEEQIREAQEAVRNALEANNPTKIQQEVDKLRESCSSDSLQKAEKARKEWLDATQETSLHGMLEPLSLESLIDSKRTEPLSEEEVTNVRKLLKALSKAESSMVAGVKRSVAEYNLLRRLCLKIQVQGDSLGTEDVSRLLSSHLDPSSGWSSRDAHKLIDESNKIVQASEGLKGSLSQRGLDFANKVLKALGQLKEEQEAYDALEPLTAFVRPDGRRIELSDSEKQVFEALKMAFVNGCNAMVTKTEKTPAAIDRKMGEIREADKKLLDGLRGGFTRVLEERNKTIPEGGRKTLDELLQLDAQGRREYFKK